jgi:hypothetical protein
MIFFYILARAVLILRILHKHHFPDNFLHNHLIHNHPDVFLKRNNSNRYLHIYILENDKNNLVILAIIQKTIKQISGYASQTNGSHKCTRYL